MITAVFDTNVLVSGFAGYRAPTSPPAQLIHLWRSRAIGMIVSEPIIAEFTRTLRRPYFRARVNEVQIAAALALLGTEARIVSLSSVVTGVAAHPEDDFVLATAVSAHADYLVTGDAALLRIGSYEGVRILSPRAFLDLLRDEQSGQ